MSQIDLKKVKEFVSANAIYIVLILLIGVIAFVDPRFLSIVCLRIFLIQSSTRIIIALGVFFIILTGGTDLSAGRMVGFAAVLSASMLQSPIIWRRFYPELPQLALWIDHTVHHRRFASGSGEWFSVARLNVPPFLLLP